jgi:hypothetical protein
MAKISDDFLKSIMSDATKLHSLGDKKLQERNPHSVNEMAEMSSIAGVGSQKTGNSTKEYLIEQLAELENLVAHIKTIINRL